MDENNIIRYFSDKDGIQIEEIWETNDVRENINSQIWLNIIVKKCR